MTILIILSFRISHYLLKPLYNILGMHYSFFFILLQLEIIYIHYWYMITFFTVHGSYTSFSRLYLKVIKDKREIRENMILVYDIISTILRRHILYTFSRFSLSFKQQFTNDLMLYFSIREGINIIQVWRFHFIIVSTAVNSTDYRKFRIIITIITFYFIFILIHSLI